MWFGDSVAPYEWSDLWLNEGHASWYEFVYAEEQGFLADDTVDYPDPEGYDTVEELMRAVYAHSDQWRHDFGPGRAPERPRRDCSASRSTTAARSCSTRCARWSGARTFQRIEREWVARYRDRVGEHGGLHRARLAGRPPRPARLPARVALRRTTPQMPGHPDWTTDPVQETPPTAKRAPGRMPRR